uniref:Synaptojanin-2-binding protein-like n=1 Tax=Ciona intestinalis TaxID=7719 RepID=A0A1W2WP51_CIOIN|nr:synaptojanin-2-binding protein-like [Ciona intestinalis]|eukprot:XP_004226645.1 synaptojanin-2-binding protein-like [Ciona intestinalis]
MAKAWEKEAAVIKLERGGSGLGFNIRGGVDQPHLPNDTGIFVTKIRENCAADIDGRLKEGDKLIEINGKSLIEVKHSEAVDYFLTAGEHVTLKVWHGAEKALVEEYTEMNKPKPWSPFTKLILVVGVAAAIGLTVYYFKRS